MGFAEHGQHKDDNAHVHVAQQVRVELRAEAAPPVAVVEPGLAALREVGLVQELVAEQQLARDDSMDGAVKVAASKLG